jgi:hypothetical protein
MGFPRRGEHISIQEVIPQPGVEIFGTTVLQPTLNSDLPSSI